MREKEWDLLLQMLERQTCVLLLGTEFLPGSHTLSAAKLAAHLGTEIERPDLASHGLAHVAERYENSERFGRQDLEYEVGQFYQQPADIPDLMSGIAALPFHLTLTTCHDDLLLRAFAAHGKAPIAEAYNFKGPARDLVPMGTVDAPLVYSLYGSPKNPGSLVVTETDLLDFLVRVITGNPGLPRNIKSELQRNVSFLFLGFGMHQWYLRILLHVLEFSRKKKAFALDPLPVGATGSKSLVFFYAGYSIAVINCELQEFVAELNRRYLVRQGALSQRPTVTARRGPQIDAKIFVCYAREDRGVADRVHRALEPEFDVWMDSDLTAGDRWDPSIEERLKESDYCVVLNSNALAAKPFSYVNKEINLALERQRCARRGIRYLIPVQIDDTPLMRDIEGLQSVRLTNDEDFAPLISAIKKDYQRRSRG